MDARPGRVVEVNALGRRRHGDGRHAALLRVGPLEGLGLLLEVRQLRDVEEVLRPRRRVVEVDGLGGLLGVGAHHEALVALGRLGRLHLEGVVVDAGGDSWLVLLRGVLAALGEAPQETRSRIEAGVEGLLQARDLEAALPRVVRILDDDVAVIGRVEVHLHDGGELVRVDPVHDGNDHSGHGDDDTCGTTGLA